MQFGRSSRKSIRYSIFVGVLAGSVFSGSGAFAEPLTQANFYLEINLNSGGTFELGGDIDITSVVHTDDGDGNILDSAPTGDTVFGTFTGILDGGGFTISGLTKPLFDQLGTSGDAASVTDLVLTATGTGFVGQGILANESMEALIENVSVSASGAITLGQDNSGGLVGSAVDTQVDNSSFSGTITSSQNYIGGLVGSAIDTQIDNSSFSGEISGFSRVGGLVGLLDCSSKSVNDCNPGASIITNSQSSGAVEGYYAVGGLVGGGWGEVSNSHADVIISGGDQLGGLVGWSEIVIDQSYSSGSVTSTTVDGNAAGGISGAQGNHLISNSYSTVEVTGHSDVGGLVGYTYGNISNSYSSVIGDVTGTGSNVGGLVGSVYQNNLISNSYSYATGNIGGIGDNIGGLVGYSYGDISNSYSYAEGTVSGNRFVGGLVGTNYDGTYGVRSITNSYAAGDVTGYEVVGGLVGNNFATITNSYSAGIVTGTGDIDIGNFLGGANTEITDDSGDIINPLTISEVVDILNTGSDSDPIFAQSAAINNGRPYLISLLCTYENPCTSGDGGSPTPVRRERVVREVMETRTLEKIEKTQGFKNDTLLPKDAVIAFLQSTDKIDIANVKAVEIAPTANVRVYAKAGEALQISLKSESKEPVELWVKSPDGTWLLAGVITFDKDGKAILPPLQFKNVGDYTLVLNKPSADSAKGSAPLNQSGSVLVAVS